MGNSTFNDNSNWKAVADRVYDYAYEYELISSNALYTYTPFNFQYVEYCGLGDSQFELMIFSSQAVSSFYSPSSICLNRQFFLKDLQTNRIIFLGNGSATSGNCTFIGSNPRPKQFCPSVTAQTIDMGEVQTIFNALSAKLVNSNGDIFAVSEIVSSIGANTKVFGVPNVYSLYFLKNGVLSVFYIMLASGQYTVIDYVEGVNDTSYTQSPNLPLPVIGSSAPQSNTNNVTSNTSSAGSNKTQNSTTTPVPSLNSTAVPPPISITSPAPTPAPLPSPAPNPVTPPTSTPITVPVPTPAPPTQVPTPVSTQNNTQTPPVIVASNNPYNFTILGDNTIPLSYIQADYPNIYNAFKPYLPIPAIPSKPAIFAQVDDEMKVVLYAVAFSYISTLYQVF